MFINSSLLLNAASNATMHDFCFNSKKGNIIFFAYSSTNILILLPLSVYILNIGFQRWRQQISTSVTSMASHADHFTYHMLAMELLGVIGSACCCIGNYIKTVWVTVVGFYSFSIIIPGQTLFHSLTCIDRYLAIVHPIIYLGLKKRAGKRIRNISIGCVWLLGFGWMGVINAYFPQYPSLPFFCFFIFSFSVSCFTSVSALFILTRPRPGGGVGNRADQSKLRALHTLLAIMAALLLRFAGLLLCTVSYKLILGAGGDPCLVFLSAFWLCLPSSLVLPVLFLHKTGKIACFNLLSPRPLS